MGLASDGDLWHGVDDGRRPCACAVRDAVVGNPYTVSPEAPIDEVVREMAGHAYGSADALTAVAELLQTRLR